jgi:hypothetical protein
MDESIMSEKLYYFGNNPLSVSDISSGRPTR